MDDAGRVELRLLGRFAALRDGVEVPPTAFAGRKVRTLVKVLATHQGRFVSHDRLAEAIWPSQLPSDPVANLQVLVNRARRALRDPSLIVTGQGGYSLAASPACFVDTEVFLAAVADRTSSMSGLLRALALWQGDPLPEEAYDDWAVDYRATLVRSRQTALERVAAAALEAGDVDVAVEQASRAVEAEPLREAAVLLLLESLAAAGDVSAALTTYDGFRRALADELGVDPSPEAAALHQRLLSQEPPPATPRRRSRRRSDFRELEFVGREGEVGQVRAALTQPATGGTLVTVGGPSGSGKSRLVTTVARDIAMVQVRAYAPERAEPWTLLRALLREVIAQDIAYVEGLPSPMLAALAWLLPDLGGGASGVDLDAETRRALVHEVALRLLDASGAVVAVDDLQWCDPTSLSILETALSRIDGFRIVATWRPDDLADGGDVQEFLARNPPAVRVDLGALPDTALGALVDDPEVAAVLRELTDRTPMAVEQVLRELAAEGLMAPSASGRWQSLDAHAPARAAELAVAGQRQAIRDRVAALSEGDRAILALLALSAREASAAALAVASAVEETAVLHVLSGLFGEDLVRLGDHGWATGHDMVTEVVASRLERADQVRLHAALARALGPTGDPLQLAHHLAEAGDIPGAADAFARAAQRALDGIADDEATQLADAGLDLAPESTVRATLFEIRGQARHRRGDIPGARDDLRSALAEHAPGHDRARVLARLAMVSSGADDIVRAAQLAELALVEAGDDASTRARALEVASVLDMNLQRPDRAAARSAEALALYEEQGDANGMARILDAQAMALFLGGDVRGGGAALRRAADLFEDSGDLVRVVTPRSTAGHALVFGGHPDDGLTQVTAALDVARALGHPEGQAYALWHRAEALVALGRTVEATEAGAEALAIATRIGHRGWTATAWRSVGLAAQARGELDDALAAFGRSLELSEHLDLFACWAAARSAVVLVAKGQPDLAVPLVERALGTGPPLGHYEARWAQVEVASALGDPSAADLARTALALTDAGGVAQGRDRLVLIEGNGLPSR